MSKKSDRPETRAKNPEPRFNDPEWIIWAAWADRITFEEIYEKTGMNEAGVIRFMRRSLKPSSFRLWRQRASEQSIKHRKKFQAGRRDLRQHDLVSESAGANHGKPSV